jgi:hypothetical protein
LGTESGHEVLAQWNEGLKVMFYEAGQEIYNLKGLALANTVQQMYHQGLKGGIGGRKKEEEGRIHERISLS